MTSPMLSRRNLIAGGAAAAAALSGTAVAARSAKDARDRRLGQIGVQLYTLRDIFAPDPMGTLERVAEIGFREVEFGGGGYEAMDHAALRKQMDRLGLAAPSLHVPFEFLDKRMDAVIATAQTLGSRIIVLPWVDPKLRGADAWPGVITAINRFGEQLAKANLRLAYHNHDFEFTQMIDGRSLFELLVAGRDPALVAFEIDLFWAVDAGQDPVALVRNLPGQIVAYHVKDRARDGSMVAVGAGAIDFASVFKLNDVTGVQHFFVEHDRPRPPYLPSVAFSYATLRNLTF
jgi:sugar phosphate isomerase/epimerase